MEEEEDEMGKVLEKNLRLWRRKLLGWRLFVFMQVSFFFFLSFFVIELCKSQNILEKKNERCFYSCFE